MAEGNFTTLHTRPTAHHAQSSNRTHRDSSIQQRHKHTQRARE